MRKGRSPFFVIDANGNNLGVNMSADFCSEHEWGTKHIFHSFGMLLDEECEKKKIFGSKRYKISELPNNLYFITDNNESYLIFANFYNSKPEDFTVEGMNKAFYAASEVRLPDFRFETMLANKKKEKFEVPSDICAAAWDERSFCVHVKGDTYSRYLKEIYEAFQRMDICIFRGGASVPVFENPGLQLIISSKIPEDAEKILTETHKDWYSLKKASEKTGIKKRLEKAQIKYFALSPTWKKSMNPGRFEDENTDTKYDVIYFLNPYDQDNNNYGYFTVEELDQWILGKGPIPKKNQVKV